MNIINSVGTKVQCYYKNISTKLHKTKHHTSRYTKHKRKQKIFIVTSFSCLGHLRRPLSFFYSEGFRLAGKASWTSWIHWFSYFSWNQVIFHPIVDSDWVMHTTRVEGNFNFVCTGEISSYIHFNNQYSPCPSVQNHSCNVHHQWPFSVVPSPRISTS